MKEKAQPTPQPLPETLSETASWLRMLAREVNTYVLFLQTWSAMGFVMSPDLVASLLELQAQVVEVREELAARGEEGLEPLRETLRGVADREESAYRSMMDEIKRFKEETEELFPAFKLNFDPCF